MVDLKSLTFEELSLFCKENGLPQFRAKQIFKWISRGVTSFDEMTDLSKALREQLLAISYLSDFKIAKKLVSKLDGTTKYLIELQDKQHIECVVMKYRHGASLCMSTQVGCAMGCSFCASTKGGLKRHLTAGEMLDQYTLISKDIGERISTVVLMGIGEPLHNFKNVCAFLKNINDENGVNLSHRHITLSTCGLTDKMDELADMGLQINLAVSLHAATDEQRQKIMPIAKKYSLQSLMNSCVNYEAKTGRRITFEYTLIGGVNDSKEDVNNLVNLLAPLKNKHVNIISVNPIEGSEYERLQDKAVEKFAKSLELKKINATVRRSLGSDIAGSCGQLRYSEEKRREQLVNITGLTDKGKVRDENQDSFVYGFLNDSIAFAGVFDGMGGAKSGKYASTVAAGGFEQKLKAADIEKLKSSPGEILTEILQEINISMYEQSCNNSEFQGMGTTAVAALIINGNATIANVGDSRAYVLDRQDCRQVTVDHSLVQGLIDMGTLTPEQAKKHPHRNVITRAMGTDDELEVDIFKEDIAGKKLLLCSDGLHGYFEPEYLQMIIMSNSDEDACELLTQQAIAKGGRDNITIVIVNCQS